MFRSVNFPWPHDRSTVLNYYMTGDCAAWEVIRSGINIGSIVYRDRSESYRFEPGVLYDGKTFENDGRATRMEGVIRANRSRLEQLEKEAVEFIKGHLRRVLDVPVIAFSGGKDSQVLLHLCSLTGKKMRVVQVDTGVDPPSNLNFSDAFLSRYPLFKIKRMGGDDIFWRALKKLGPPATDFQWCREILKKTATFRERKNYLLGVVKFLQRVFRTRVIFIEGTRRREEPWRVILKKDVEIKSPMINATDIRPIVEFTDLDIWMYLKLRNIPIHPTYTVEKNQRMICLFCPDKTCEEMNRVRDNSPAQWNRFYSELERWRTVFGFPEQWTTKNLWMRDKPVSRYRQELGIGSRIGMVRNRLNSVIEVAESGMRDDVYRSAMKIHGPFEMHGLKRWLRPFGKITGGAGGRSFSVITAEHRIEVYENGAIHVARFDTAHRSASGDLLRHWMVSYLNCIGCGACTVNCSKITIKNAKSHIGLLCNGCAACIQPVVATCPLNAIGLERCIESRQDS